MELREKYNPDNLFKNKQNNVEINQQSQTALVEYKEDSIFKKIKRFILSIIKRWWLIGGLYYAQTW